MHHGLILNYPLMVGYKIDMPRVQLRLLNACECYILYIRKKKKEKKINRAGDGKTRWNCS